MPTNRQLKLELRKEQNHYHRMIQQVLAQLSTIDPTAALLSLEKVAASRTLVKKLWDLLPDESESFTYDSIEEQTNTGKLVLPTRDFSQPITLHLGWEVLSFSCSLDAAWHTWQHFNTISSTETFNCCLYPESLDWHIIRAGNNLYPMIATADGYVLRKT